MDGVIDCVDGSDESRARFLVSNFFNKVKIFFKMPASQIDIIVPTHRNVCLPKQQTGTVQVVQMVRLETAYHALLVRN